MVQTTFHEKRSYIEHHTERTSTDALRNQRAWKPVDLSTVIVVWNICVFLRIRKVLRNECCLQIRTFKCPEGCCLLGESDVSNELRDSGQRLSSVILVSSVNLKMVDGDWCLQFHIDSVTWRCWTAVWRLLLRSIRCSKET